MRYVLLVIPDDDQAQDLLEDMADHPDEPLLTPAGHTIHAAIGGTWQLIPVPSGADLEPIRCKADDSIIAEGYSGEITGAFHT